MTRTWLVPLAAYGLGAIPFAYLVARRGAGIDVRQAGSGNVGATNVLRTAGPVLAAIVLLLDIGKGAAAIWIARRAGLSAGLVAISGLAAILGHVYPVWLGFRGGKGVATTSGVFALLAPRALLIVLIVFAIVAGATRYVSLAAVVGAVVLPIAAIATGEPIARCLAACAAALIVLVRHRHNVARLRAGTEPTIGHRVRGDR